MIFMSTFKDWCIDGDLINFEIFIISLFISAGAAGAKFYLRNVSIVVVVTRWLFGMKMKTGRLPKNA